MTYLQGTYTGTFATPWFSTLVSGFAWEVQDWSNYVGSNTVTTAPSAAIPSGLSFFDGGSSGGPALGNAELETQMQYYGQVAAFPTNTEVSVTFYWNMIWLAEADGGLCGTGCASSYAWIHVAANILDVGTNTVPSNTWLVDGDVTQVIANEQNYVGNPAVGSGNQYYTTTINGCFLANTYYQLFTYLQTESYAVGALGDWASSSVDIQAAQVSLGVQTTGVC